MPVKLTTSGRRRGLAASGLDNQATDLARESVSGGRADSATEGDCDEVVDVSRRTASLWRRVRKDFAVLGAGSLGIIFAQLAFRSILIVAIAPSGYGRLSLVLSLYNTAMLIGISGLPDTAARYIAMKGPAVDSTIVRASARAAFWPTAFATILVSVASGVLLHSWLAGVFGALGLVSLIYSLLALGILRGRGLLRPAAAIMPAAAATEVLVLAAIWKSGVGVTPISAFGFFCLGNVVGVALGFAFVVHTRPRVLQGAPSNSTSAETPRPRELLNFSLWLTVATVGIALMPLVMRLAAALESYTVVATVDVSLVLLSLPQRVGSVIVSAVIPHASRDAASGKIGLAISRREHVIVLLPFLFGAALVAFTPIVGQVFRAIGRPAYGESANYLALALLAGPARVLYGLVQGVLIAHGEGRFLAWNSLGITVLASVLIFTIAALGSTLAAFAVFVAACWAVHLGGIIRIRRLVAVRGGA